MSIFTFLHIYYAVFALLFGIVLGSFLNVVIYRLPAGRTISKGRSNCMTCGHTLAAKDLVPLFSWLFLKGKCRYCGAPIASRYAKIESLTGVVFLLTALSTIDAIACVVIHESFFILYMVYAILFMIVMCTVVPAMMIYYDTFKGFIHLAGISVVLSAVAYVMMYLFPSQGNMAVAAARFIGVVAAFPLLTLLLLKISGKQYGMDDFYMDLTFAGASTFEYVLCPKGRSFFVFIFPVAYCIVRAVCKGKKQDKYAGIIYFGIMIAALCITAVYRFLY